MLDVGAKIQGGESRQLVEFALMGAGMARALFGVDKAISQRLLNIGVEEVKEVEEIRKAAAGFGDPLPIRYHGFVEGDNVGKGVVAISSSPTVSPATSP